MTRPDERAFFLALKSDPHGAACSGWADDIAMSLGMPRDRAAEILAGWAARGWWEWGISDMFSGWFTDARPEVMP